MALCPNLLVLDLRDCDVDEFFFMYKRVVFPPKLRSVTVVECEGHPELKDLSSLRSFRYSGCDEYFWLAKDATLADLYICFDITGNSDTSTFNRSLPNDLSGLTVLTICSYVLKVASLSWRYEPVTWLNSSLREQQQVASSSGDDGSATQNPKLCNLPSLRELQLLILYWKADTLANIYLFLKTCQCPNLERIFVRFPIFDCDSMMTSDVVVEEPPEGVLGNLKLVKIMNFNWRHIEVQLVSFLLRKASSLHTLLLVSRNVAPLAGPGVQEADLLLLKEAISNGKIKISESDDSTIQPYHSEVFI